MVFVLLYCLEHSTVFVHPLAVDDDGQLVVTQDAIGEQAPVELWRYEPAGD